MSYTRAVLISLIAFIYSLEAGLSGSKPGGSFRLVHCFVMFGEYIITKRIAGSDNLFVRMEIKCQILLQGLIH